MIKIADLQPNYILEYDVNNRQFVIMENGGHLFTAETQDKCEAKLDRYIKSHTANKCPINAITSNGMDEVTITSFVSETNDVWITTLNGRRKNSLYNYSRNPYFFEVTEENRSIVNKYKELEKQIKIYQSELYKLERNLKQPITEEYFKITG